MNPESNKLEKLSPGPIESAVGESPIMDALAGKLANLSAFAESTKGLVRPDGSPVPEHWAIFVVDDEVILKGYRFRVAHIGESHMLLEPVGPVLVEPT